DRPRTGLASHPARGVVAARSAGTHPRTRHRQVGRLPRLFSQPPGRTLTMKTIVVLEFDLENPEAIAGILTAIDPPNLPPPASSARIAVAMPAARVVE